MESTERLEEIERDLRADHRAYSAKVKELEAAGKHASYERGKAWAFDVAANRIAGEIEEIQHA